MANICTTWYSIYGNEEELKEFYELLKPYDEDKTPTAPNEWWHTWMGNIIKALGGEPSDYDCSGEWQYLEYYPGSHIAMQVDSKWSPCNDVFELVREKFTSFRVWWQSEEFGCLWYVTNDPNNSVFSEKWYVSGNDLDGEYYNYDEEDTMLQHINEYKGTNFKTVDELKAYLEAQGDNEDDLFFIECEYDDTDNLADEN
jgi:hypothetical protein